MLPENKIIREKSVEETLRNAAYTVAVKYREEVRKLQESDARFLRSISRDFTFIFH